MHDPVLEVIGVKKRFRAQKAATSLKYAFLDWIQRKESRRPASAEFWALRGVSFSVQQGEVVGIIGANGSGKSTLLKILSRILEPDEGSVKVRGRLASLLELGAGFQPELTGRRNVYLYGSVLGFSQKEIDERFDQIVSFAELEGFIDVPVKSYSSGMYVRLAFAVAIHLDPDILILDEVLAVGDIAFQRKCLNAIYALRDRVKTILLVTHNLSEVQQFCTRAILIDGGHVLKDGAPEEVVAYYRQLMWGRHGVLLGEAPPAPAPPPAQPAAQSQEQVVQPAPATAEVQATMRVELTNERGEPLTIVRPEDTIVVNYHYNVSGVVKNPAFGCQIFRNTHGFPQAIGVNTVLSNHSVPFIANEGCMRLVLKSHNLVPGDYVLSAGLFTEGFGQPLAHHRKGTFFQVVGAQKQEGPVFVPHEWILEQGPVQGGGR
jgi:ABC-type polysaccharide/polyol phosphate transport system ATPase subunit